MIKKKGTAFLKNNYMHKTCQKLCTQHPNNNSSKGKQLNPKCFNHLNNLIFCK